MSKIYFDTAPLIYFLDNEKPFSDIIANYLLNHQSNDDSYTTSSITDAEYLVFPYRNKNLSKIQAYFKFLEAFGFDIIKPNREITQLAAALRAQYHSLKGMDAIHLSTSIYKGCDIFLTNDLDLIRVKEAKVVLVDNLK